MRFNRYIEQFFLATHQSKGFDNAYDDVAGSGHGSSLWLLDGFLQLFDNAKIFEGGHVPGGCAGGDEFFEQAADDFSGACFRQRGSKVDVVRLGDGTDHLADMVAQIAVEGVGGFDLGFQCDEGDDGLAFEFVGATDHGGFGDVGVVDESTFDFCGAEPVTGDVEDVVETTDDPEVAVFVALGTVAGEVVSGVFGPVGFFEARFIAVDGAGHGWPWFTNDEASGLVGFAFVALIIENNGIDSKEWQGGGAGDERGGTGDGGDHNGTGFGLPPGIDDGAAAAADFFIIPAPGFGVDRFADAAEEAE